MYKSCSRCGKIHDSNFKCNHGRVYIRDREHKLRSTNKWTKKSLEIRERANYLCEVCRDEGKITYEGLEVHHIDKLREDETKLLDDRNLICLCAYHHKLADENAISKDYLRKLALARDKKESPLPL